MIKIYKKEIGTVFTHWFGYILYSHLSFFAQKLIVSGYMSLKLSYYVLILIEQGLLFGSSWVIYKSDTLSTTRFVDFFIMMPHFFKMNSYSKTNRDYYLEFK